VSITHPTLTKYINADVFEDICRMNKIYFQPSHTCLSLIILINTFRSIIVNLSLIQIQDTSILIISIAEMTFTYWTNKTITIQSQVVSNADGFRQTFRNICCHFFNYWVCWCSIRRLTQAYLSLTLCLHATKLGRKLKWEVAICILVCIYLQHEITCEK